MKYVRRRNDGISQAVSPPMFALYRSSLGLSHFDFERVNVSVLGSELAFIVHSTGIIRTQLFPKFYLGHCIHYPADRDAVALPLQLEPPF